MSIGWRRGASILDSIRQSQDRQDCADPGKRGAARPRSTSVTELGSRRRASRCRLGVWGALMSAQAQRAGLAARGVEIGDVDAARKAPGPHALAVLQAATELPVYELRAVADLRPAERAEARGQPNDGARLAYGRGTSAGHRADASRYRRGRGAFRWPSRRLLQSGQAVVSVRQSTCVIQSPPKRARSAALPRRLP